MGSGVNRILYAGFLLLGLFQCFWAKDYLQAATSFGIGLAFDPFDQAIKWSERPVWQRSFLIVHLGILIFLFVFGFCTCNAIVLCW